MVHKKYTYRNGKRYGPYIYENKRVGDKVVTTYKGKDENRYSFYNILLFVFFILVGLALFYLFSFKITGYPILGLSSFLTGNGTCSGCTINGSVEFSNLHSDNTDSNLISYWQFTSDARDSKGIFNLSVNGASKEHERYYFDGVNDYLNASCSFNCVGTPSDTSCSQFTDIDSCDAYGSHGGECISSYVCSGTPNTECSVYTVEGDCNANTGGGSSGHYDGCSWVGEYECTGSLTCEAQISQNSCGAISGCSWNYNEGYGWDCSGIPFNQDCMQWFGDETNCMAFDSHGGQCTWHGPTDNYRCAGTAYTPSCAVFLNEDSCGHEDGCGWNWGSCDCTNPLTGAGDCTGTLTCAGQTTQSACQYFDGGTGALCEWNTEGETPVCIDHGLNSEYTCPTWNGDQTGCEAESRHSGQCTYHSEDYQCLTCLAQNDSVGCNTLLGCSVNVLSGFPLEGTGNWSILAWIKTNETSGNIISVGDTGSATMRLSIFGNGLLETPYSYSGSGVLNGFKINDNSWHQIGLTYNGSIISMYNDGVLSDSELSDPVNIRCSSGVTIGNRPISPLNFSGRIDEVKVYNRSLNSSDIFGLYNSGLFRQTANYTSVFYDLSAKKHFRNISWNGEFFGAINTSSGLLLRLTMDLINSSNSFIDSSPYSRNATNMGAVIQNDSGKLGKSASFNGLTGSYLLVRDINISHQDYTLSVWVKRNNAGRSEDFIFGQGSGCYHHGLIFQFQGGDTINFGTCGDAIFSDNPYADTSDWHHYVGTFTRSPCLQRLYVDGIEVATEKWLSCGDYQDVGDFYVGKSWQGNNFFNGSIDEVLVYNRSLSPREIYQLYLNSSRISSWNLNNISLQVRSASNSTDGVGYSAWSSLLSNSTFSSLLSIPANRYVQFRAFFNSNESSLDTLLNSVSINYLDDDTTSPGVTIVFPANDGTYTSPITFNVTLNEVGEVKITLNNGITNYTMSSTDGLTFNYTNSSIAIGNYILKVYANDTLGNKNYTENVNFSIVLDSIPPSVTIVSPTSTTYTVNNYNINITLNEAGYCEYSLNSGSSNLTLSAGNSNREFTGTKTGVSNGDYTLSAYCNDSSGNKNYTESRTFSVSVSASPSSGGGGGGGGGGGAVLPNGTVIGRVISAQATYNPENEQLISGHRQVMKKNESLKFYVKDIPHILTMNYLIGNSISITIASSPIDINLTLGEQTEVDVDSDGSKDVLVQFSSIKDSNAEVFVKLISKQETINLNNRTAVPDGNLVNIKFDFKKYITKEILIGLAVGILILAFAIYRVVRRRIMEERWEKSRQQFKWRPVGEVKVN